MIQNGNGEDDCRVRYRTVYRSRADRPMINEQQRNDNKTDITPNI